MDKMKIRKANTKDIPYLIDIVNGISSIEDYPGEFNSLYFKNMLKKNNVLVGIINGEVIGFIDFRYDKDAKRVFLESLAVSKKFRRKGVGERLFDEVENFSKVHKVIRMSGLTRNWNDSVNNLCKKRHFKKIDTLYLWEKGLK